MRLGSLLAGATLSLGITLGGAASATIVTVFDGIAGGRAAFDATVTGTGGAVENTVLTGLAGGPVVDAGDFTIKNNDGNSVFFQNYGTMSGRVVGIDPALNSGSPPQPPNGRLPPEFYFNSGFTLTFAKAINAVGFEVGDWATCCHNPVTELYISFDGGTPILVASALTSSNGLFPSQTTGSLTYEIFVSAIDDSGTFTEVSFWGNGLGEFLVAGGDIRYAAIDVGSLPPTNVIPLPAAGWLLLAGIGGLGMLRRRKQALAA